MPLQVPKLYTNISNMFSENMLQFGRLMTMMVLASHLPSATPQHENMQHQLISEAAKGNADNVRALLQNNSVEVLYVSDGNDLLFLVFRLC